MAQPITLISYGLCADVFKLGNSVGSWRQGKRNGKAAEALVPDVVAQNARQGAQALAEGAPRDLLG